MATKLISFRLTEDAIAALKLHRKTGESVNLTAQRLLTDLLGVPAKVATSSATASALAVNNIVDNIVNSDYFREVLADTLASVINGVNGKNAEIEQKVDSLTEAFQHLVSRVNNSTQNGAAPSNEVVVMNDDITTEMSDEPESLDSDYGSDVEPLIEVTPEPGDNVAPSELGLPDDEERATEDAIAVEQPPTLMCGVEGLADRLKISSGTIEKRAKSMEPEAFAKFYRKKDRDGILWYPQKNQPVIQFIGVKEDVSSLGKEAQDTPLLNLIGAIA